MTSKLIRQLDASQAARSSDASMDHRVYTSLHRLAQLQHKSRGLSFLPRQPVQSLLAGRHASRVRGRGLNFEEIRQYHAGDDVRTIDWKVTARLRSAHTRVYTEERDRPVLLVVDQRIGMFFGSKLYMKSVIAAESAALAAWRALDAGDRVGAIIFDDDGVDAIDPRRSRHTVLRILNSIVDKNQRLSADSPAVPRPAALNEVLDKAARVAHHDYLVVVISDFHGYDDDTFKTLRSIRTHNDMICVLVHDPSASKLQIGKNMVITDGELQVEIEFSGRKTRRRIQDASSGRIAKVLELQTQLQTPVLPIHSGQDAATQLNRLLGLGRR